MNVLYSDLEIDSQIYLQFFFSFFVCVFFFGHGRHTKTHFDSNAMEQSGNMHTHGPCCYCTKIIFSNRQRVFPLLSLLCLCDAGCIFFRRFFFVDFFSLIRLEDCAVLIDTLEVQFTDCLLLSWWYVFFLLLCTLRMTCDIKLTRSRTAFF